MVDKLTMDLIFRLYGAHISLPGSRKRSCPGKSIFIWNGMEEGTLLTLGFLIEILNW